MLKNIIFLFVTIINAHGGPYEDGQWNGKWFPHSPNEPDLNPDVTLKAKSPSHLYDKNHGILMGIKDSNCDDGETNLKIDWYMEPDNYTCSEDRHLFLPNSDVHPLHSIEHIPSAYSAPHKCMNESINYSERIPTFGTHRPLWAQYGEYTFLPKQRWIHNLEHGAVVMLYHPCANREQVMLLKKLLKSCLYRHIITPYNLLTAERSLALVTWGHRLEMSKVASEVVVDFIKQHALHGDEKTHRDGQYNLLLIEHAEVVSDIEDSGICKKSSGIVMK